MNKKTLIILLTFAVILLGAVIAGVFYLYADQQPPKDSFTEAVKETESEVQEAPKQKKQKKQQEPEKQAPTVAKATRAGMEDP